MVKSVTRSQPEAAAFTVTVDKTEHGGTKGFSTKYPSLHFNHMFIIWLIIHCGGVQRQNCKEIVSLSNKLWA